MVALGPRWPAATATRMTPPSLVIDLLPQYGPRNRDSRVPESQLARSHSSARSRPCDDLCHERTLERTPARTTALREKGSSRWRRRSRVPGRHYDRGLWDQRLAKAIALPGMRWPTDRPGPPSPGVDTATHSSSPTSPLPHRMRDQDAHERS